MPKRMVLSDRRSKHSLMSEVDSKNSEGKNQVENGKLAGNARYFWLSGRGKLMTVRQYFAKKAYVERDATARQSMDSLPMRPVQGLLPPRIPLPVRVAFVAPTPECGQARAAAVAAVAGVQRRASCRKFAPAPRFPHVMPCWLPRRRFSRAPFRLPGDIAYHVRRGWKRRLTR